MSAGGDIKSEERLIPVIRAKLAEKLAGEGFRVKDIAEALKVTQPAITQYLKGRRGTVTQTVPAVDSLVNPMAEKLSKRIHAGLGGIETTELLETARQVMVMSAGRKFAQGSANLSPKVPIELLRRRLRLELSAAEKYLELANKTPDDHVKLLLRMISSDSIRHGDVVSQIMSWLESGSELEQAVPSAKLLKSMLSIEDSAGEVSLKENVEVNHPIVRLLLEWIDIDEDKHERIVKKLLALTKKDSR
jgi:predicted transcriptional regulator